MPSPIQMATRMDELARRFSPADLPGQWLIAKDANLIPDGWPFARLGTLHVAWNAPLPCTYVRANGTACGVILGWYIGSDGVLLGDVALPAPAGFQDIERMLASLAGNFVCLAASAGGEARFYVDACGSLAAFYTADQQCISSSIFLIPKPQGGARYVEGFDIPGSNCMFPVGMTPRTDVERLLPSHYLDLTQWRAVRHWPAVPAAEQRDPAKAVDAIGDLVARNIAAIGSEVPVQMSLTAGRDSRMLLACARPLARDIACFTAALPDRNGRLDVHVAERLARKFELRHKTLPFLGFGERESAMWLYRTSVSVGEKRGYEAMRTFMQLDPGRAYLPGLVAELARGFYWSGLEDLPEPKSRERLCEPLLKSMHAPITEETLGRMSGWLSGVPATDLRTVLDFYYLEQRLGCWAGVFGYAYADIVRFESWPLNSRRIVELMLSLPLEYRAAGRLNEDIIRRRWPALAQLPFNKGDLRFKLLDPLAHPAEEAARLRLAHALAHPLWAARKIQRKVRRKLSPTVGY